MIELVSSTELVAITALLGTLLPIQPVVAKAPFQKKLESCEEDPAGAHIAIGQDALPCLSGFRKQCLRKQRVSR